MDSLLTGDLEYNTYWTAAIGKQGPDYQGTSRIDHFLLKDGGGITAPSFTLYTGSYWSIMSDHRPLLCWLTGPAFVNVEPAT